MIFTKTWKSLMRGHKHQTRRRCRVGEEPCTQDEDIVAVLHANGRTRYRVGRRDAIQPGRGRAAMGSFRLARIQRQRLTDITAEDIAAEGFVSADDFWATW